MFLFSSSAPFTAVTTAASIASTSKSSRSVGGGFAPGGAPSAARPRAPPRCATPRPRATRASSRACPQNRGRVCRGAAPRRRSRRGAAASRSRRSNAFSSASSSKTSSSCRDTSSARNAHWNSESPFRNTFTCSYFRFNPPRDKPGGFNEPVRRSSAAAAAAAAAKGSASQGEMLDASFSEERSSSSPGDVSPDARRPDASLLRSRSRLRFDECLAAVSSAAHAARSSSKREPFSAVASFSFSFSSSSSPRCRPARDGGAGPRRAPSVSPSARSGRGARSFLSARRFSRSASRRCRAFASRRAHSKRRARISSEARVRLRLPTSSPNFSGSRSFVSRRSPVASRATIPSSPSFTFRRSSRSRLRDKPESAPRRLRRAAASRSRRRSCLRSARRNAMPCSSRTSNLGRARRSRVDRAHAASASRTASGARRRGGRGSGAPRRDPRRDAPRRPSVEPSRNNDSLVSFSRSSRTLRLKVLLTHDCHDVAELHLAGRAGPGLASVARVVSSAREPRGPHNTGHMPAGPFASSVGVGRAEPEWAALNKVTGVCGEGTRA